jgi:C1A family cysteine protease
MAELTFQAIGKEIRGRKAGWKAKNHPVLRLSGPEQVRRLGVILEDRRLAELRARPKPDMVRLIAQLKGLRLYGRHEIDDAILEAIHRRLQLRLRVVDWRNRNGRNNVTPVRDQGGCGSCVAFGTTAVLESMILIEHNVTLDLSEAELLFCGGGSCGGWWPDSAVTYLLNSGVAHESCFAYQPMNMPCQTCPERDGEAVKITSSTVLNDVGQRKQYLANIGPMMCVFEVYGDFFGYGSGVYSHVAGSFVGLHCVQVVGFNEAQACWIAKNSWGAGWGEAGFFRIAYGQCGIDSTFPFWGISGAKWYAP